MKHTPGPWTVSPEWPFPDNQGRKHDAVVVKYRNGDEALICSFEHGVMRDSQNANARLIAAAPELLAALKALQASPDLESCHVLAMKAIMKAEGR